MYLCVQTDVRYRCELTSLAWVLSLATAGNLLAVKCEQTPGYARSLTKVCTWVECICLRVAFMSAVLALPSHIACYRPCV